MGTNLKHGQPLGLQKASLGASESRRALSSRPGDTRMERLQNIGGVKRTTGTNMGTLVLFVLTAIPLLLFVVVVVVVF